MIVAVKLWLIFWWKFKRCRCAYRHTVSSISMLEYAAYGNTNGSISHKKVIWNSAYSLSKRWCLNSKIGVALICSKPQLWNAAVSSITTIAGVYTEHLELDKVGDQLLNITLPSIQLRYISHRMPVLCGGLSSLSRRVMLITWCYQSRSHSLPV